MKDYEKKAAKRLKWINNKADEIQKKHPKMTRKEAMKKAGAKYCKCRGKKKND